MNLGMVDDEIFDLLGTNLFTGTVDHVLDAARHDELSRMIALQHVTRAIEASFGESTLIVLRCLVVAANSIRSTYEELAYFAVSYIFTIFIYDAILIVAAKLDFRPFQGPPARDH